MQARIERELGGGQEEAQEMVEGPEVGVVTVRVVQVSEPEGAAQNAEEVIKWMARQLMENEGRDVEELKERAIREFGSLESLTHVHWVVMRIKEGPRRGKEYRRRRERKRGRRMNAIIQMESVRSSGVSVQMDDLGVLLHCLMGRSVAGALA